MRAVAVNPGKRTVGLVERPEPRIEKPTQAKLKVLEVGVCGTDRDIVSFEYGTPPPGSAELVIGHECLARVEDVGDKVTGVEPGDLVVPMVRRPCGRQECLPCRDGRPDFCVTGLYTERGIKGRDGYMAETVVVDAAYLNVVPASLRRVAVLTEPLTIAEKAIIEVRTVQQRLPWRCLQGFEGTRDEGSAVQHCHNALVLGAGPVGLLGGMALAANDFKVFVYSKEPGDSQEAAVVKAFGATYVSSSEHAVGDLRAVVGNIDLIYEATGSSRFAFDVLPQLGINGIFVFTGVPGKHGPTSLDTDVLMRSIVLTNQVVMGTVNAGRDAFRAAIRDLAVFQAHWPDAIGRVITGRHAPEQVPDVLRTPKKGIKDIVVLGGPVTP